MDSYRTSSSSSSTRISEQSKKKTPSGSTPRPDPNRSTRQVTVHNNGGRTISRDTNRKEIDSRKRY